MPALDSQVVNRLQRELETVLSNYRILEKRLEAEGIDLRSISQLAPLSTDTECVPARFASVPDLNRLRFGAVFAQQRNDLQTRRRCESSFT